MLARDLMHAGTVSHCKTDLVSPSLTTPGLGGTRLDATGAVGRAARVIATTTHRRPTALFTDLGQMPDSRDGNERGALVDVGRMMDNGSSRASCPGTQ